MTPESSANAPESADRPSLLIIGATKTGKTHYGGQLLRRLQKRRGELLMAKTPSDLSVFEEVCARLANGRSAAHTPTGFYRESLWDVSSADKALEAKLIWPDYGGEDVENITTLRHLAEGWVQRIRESQGWLLFVRLSLLKPPEDVLSRPRSQEQMSAAGKSVPSARTNSVEDGQRGTNEDDHGVPIIADPHSDAAAGLRPAAQSNLSDQARLVELLQALMFARQVGVSTRLRQPALLIALSCWDEISEVKRDGAWTLPATLLHERLPLLSDFINSNWERDFVEVMGLSALGRALRDDVSDEEFMDSGPERQGWCILPDGKESSDLTLPVLLLMEKMNHAMSIGA